MFIFDFRVRPPFDPTTQSIMGAELNKYYEICNDTPAARSVVHKDMDLFWQELADAGTTRFLYQGRVTDWSGIAAWGYEGDTSSFTRESNNDAVRSFITQYQDKAFGAYAVDPAEGTACLGRIESNVLNGPFIAVTMEPGLCSCPMPLDDVRCLGIYDYLEKQNIPLVLAFGELNYRSLRQTLPVSLDNICELFPKLKITVIHGGWPFVHEIQWITYNRKNLYICVDFFMNHTWSGYRDYITAANYAFQDKIIFGSAYPFWDMKKAVEVYSTVLKPEVLPKVMGINALYALNLEYLLPEDAPSRMWDLSTEAPKNARDILFENHII